MQIAAGDLMDKTTFGDTFKVGAVTLVCIAVVALVTARMIHNQIDLAVMGPVLLFLGYMVSDAWAPLPEWNPTWFWSLAIVFGTIVEIVFVFFY